MLSVEDVIDVLAVDLLGIVPEDEQVIISTNRGQPLALDGRSPAGKGFTNIAARLMGEDVPLLSLESETLFSRVKRFFTS
jgi:septum site-determining protein MinD